MIHGRYISYKELAVFSCFLVLQKSSSQTFTVVLTTPLHVQSEKLTKLDSHVECWTKCVNSKGNKATLNLSQGVFTVNLEHIHQNEQHIILAFLLKELCVCLFLLTLHFFHPAKHSNMKNTKMQPLQYVHI